MWLEPRSLWQSMEVASKTALSPDSMSSEATSAFKDISQDVFDSAKSLDTFHQLLNAVAWFFWVLWGRIWTNKSIAVCQLMSTVVGNGRAKNQLVHLATWAAVAALKLSLLRMCVKSWFAWAKRVLAWKHGQRPKPACRMRCPLPWTHLARLSRAWNQQHCCLFQVAVLARPHNEWTILFCH